MQLLIRVYCEAIHFYGCLGGGQTPLERPVRKLSLTLGAQGEAKVLVCSVPELSWY